MSGDAGGDAFTVSVNLLPSSPPVCAAHTHTHRMDPPASAACSPRSDLILLSEEQPHLDRQAPWWDSPSLEPGPTSHEEHGVVRVVDLNVVGGGGEAEPVPQRWSPLSAADMEHIYEEANRLARQLHKVALKEAVGEVHFVAPFRRAEAAARSSRRETYVVRDSPVRLLLPDISREGDSLLLLDAEEVLSHPVSDGAVDTPCGGEDIPARCKAMPSHKDMPAGHKAPPTEGKAPASRDRCATNRSKATSGGAARGMLAPQRGFEPKTRSLGVKQRDPRSSRSAESAAQCRPRAAGAQKAEQRGARLVAPTSQLPRVSNTREQDGSRLQASRSGAPLLSYTGRGLVGSSVLPMARRKGPGKPASTRVPRAALGRSAPQPWGQAPDPGLRKGLRRVPLTGQGSASAGTRTTQVSATGGPKLTQTGSQRAG